MFPRKHRTETPIERIFRQVTGRKMNRMEGATYSASLDPNAKPTDSKLHHYPISSLVLLQGNQINRSRLLRNKKSGATRGIKKAGRDPGQHKRLPTIADLGPHRCREQEGRRMAGTTGKAGVRSREEKKIIQRRRSRLRRWQGEATPISVGEKRWCKLVKGYSRRRAQEDMKDA